MLGKSYAWDVFVTRIQPKLTCLFIHPQHCLGFVDGRLLQGLEENHLLQ